MLDLIEFNQKIKKKRLKLTALTDPKGRAPSLLKQTKPGGREVKWKQGRWHTASQRAKIRACLVNLVPNMLNHRPAISITCDLDVRMEINRERGYPTPYRWPVIRPDLIFKHFFWFFKSRNLYTPPYTSLTFWPKMALKRAPVKNSFLHTIRIQYFI